MKYIFPKNYNFKSKLFGIIDYPTAIFNVIIFAIDFLIAKVLFTNLTIKIFFIVLMYFPFFLFCVFGFNNENVLYILYYILKFVISPKFYIYRKEYTEK